MTLALGCTLMSACAEVMEPMNLETAIGVVDTFLHSLADTGVSGFEGLAAALIERATGQEFRLSSAGRQSGRDAASPRGTLENRPMRDTSKPANGQ